MNKLMLCALAVLVTIAVAGPARALGPLDVAAELPLYSKYVWRGTNSTNDWVLQPSLEVGVLGFTAGIWANMDLKDGNKEKRKFREIDYKVEYSLGVPLVSLSAGFLHYQYPQSSIDNTTEFYLTGSLEVILSPSLTVYQDIDKYKGAYWEAIIEQGIKVGDGIDLDLSSGLGLGSKSYISGYFADQASVPIKDLGASMTDFFVRAEMPLDPIPFLTLTPSVTYTSLLGDGRKALNRDGTLYAGKKENVVVGIAAGFSF